MSEAAAALQLLPWQRPAWQRLAEVRGGGRMPHALLISGARGSGKQQFARLLAAALLCRVGAPDGLPCGACADCRQVAAGAHPGLSSARPEEDKREIAVDAVRALCERLALTSHDGGTKVAVIEPVDALNLSGVNALLKTVEEPPPRSHVLLIAERPLALRPTLRSRCQQLRLRLPPRADALAWLTLQVAEAAAADLDAALDGANGAPLLALELLRGGGLELQRGWRKLLAEFGRGHGDPVAAAAAVGEPQAGAFLRWSFGVLLELLRRPGAAAAQRQAGRLADELVEHLQRLDGNARPQLVLEAALIGWQRLLAPPGHS